MFIKHNDKLIYIGDDVLFFRLESKWIDITRMCKYDPDMCFTYSLLMKEYTPEKEISKIS